jgi:glycosyltransferase involved in cell wall biosynthesis
MITKGGVINENGNGLLVDTAKNHKLWAKYVNKLANDREMLHKLQVNLHETVKDTYSLATVTAKRVELYKKLIKEKN